jgi:uncharacterized membrane protein YfcA
MSLTVTLVIILIIVGIASGLLSGLVGVGGGIIIVPALVYFASFSQKAAQGTSLGILLLPVGILAVMQYYKQGQVDVRIVLIVSVAFVVGGYFGSKLAISLPEHTLKKVFAILLLTVAIKYLFFDNNAEKNTGKKVDINKIEIDKNK